MVGEEKKIYERFSSFKPPFFVRNTYAQEATHSFFPLNFLTLINFAPTFGSRVRGEHTSFIAYSGHGASLWTVLYFF